MKLDNLSLATALSLEIKEIEQRLEEIRNFAQNLVGKDETQNSFELSTVLKRKKKKDKKNQTKIELHPSVIFFNYNTEESKIDVETKEERIGFQLSNTESLVILDFFVKKLEFERKSKLEKLKEIGVEI